MGKQVSQPAQIELSAREGRVVSLPETKEFVFNQTMLRIRDPQRSLDFYQGVLGMTLIRQFDFPDMKFTLFFLGYVTPDDEKVPEDPVERSAYAFEQKAMLERSGRSPGSAAIAGLLPERSGNDPNQAVRFS